MIHLANLCLSDGKPTQVIEGIPMHIILGAPRQPEPYNDTYPMTSPLALQDGSIQFRLSIIADLDRKSRDANDSSTFNSYLKSGRFTIQPEWKGASIVWNDNSTVSTGVGTENKTIDPDSSQTMYYGAGGRINSQFAFGNRGMELSSLVTFNGKLYACEDRTGIIFQIVDHKVIPWVILADGNGTRPRGFKCEWTIVRDEHLYVGSHSADIKHIHRDGPSVEAGQRWVKKISKEGLVEHLDWEPVYLALEQHLGVKPPGYVMHETVLWSDIQKTWYFMPRQISHENYTEERHPYTCSNLMIYANENFTDIRSMPIGEHNPIYGFSAARFVPGTDDTVIIALRIMEIDEIFSTRIIVFSITGTIHLVEEEVLNGLKYEGLEFT
ncbi:hypothetical protein RvY_07299-2 [Ramazzottius varieornatus]|uniref:Apyrase n=1 Tax=Ramazzottius varieornatus TaxID=947166 RepID=A0A1D1V7S5_RAMVA|nr:hypothetical protein RvY_07299-2 [Ramazzottius varieornatus]